MCFQYFTASNCLCYVFVSLYVMFLSHSAKAIDEYANLKTKVAEANDESAVIDPRLEAIVERMLDKYV